jgi:hypothetical protein
LANATGASGPQTRGLVLALAVAGLCGCGQVASLESRARILSEPACTDFFFPIYFARDSADLSRPAQTEIAGAGRHTAGCMVAQVTVVGLPANPPPSGPGLGESEGPAPDLAHERARRLAQALIGAGLPEPVFQISPFGAAGAAAQGAPGQGRRRADVYIRFQH